MKGHSVTQREPSSAAKKARAVEMLALGHGFDEIAKAVGVSPRTVANWQSQHAAAIVEAADDRIEGVAASVANGAAEARRLLAERAPKAARVLLGYIDGDEPENAPGAGVRLRAAMTLLDRVGVPVLTKLEHSGEVVSEATLAKLRAALKAAKE